jgi:hypothetical protein
MNQSLNQSIIEPTNQSITKQINLSTTQASIHPIIHHGPAMTENGPPNPINEKF